jgi:hypothetical protein
MKSTSLTNFARDFDSSKNTLKDPNKKLRKNYFVQESDIVLEVKEDARGKDKKENIKPKKI